MLDLKNKGLSENTLHTVSHILQQLNKNADLMNPQEILTFIVSHKTKNSTKQKMVNCYEYFCKTNNLEFKKPRFKYEETIPIIPTTESVTKIISASTRRYATIFTILAETGLEGAELHTLHRKNIDTERGIISIEGHKGHDSGTYKLKQATADMLREYLIRKPQEYPFPTPKSIGNIWRRTRNKLANTLKQPELKNIPLKNLRNYSGAQVYYKTNDFMTVVRHLRHKKVETTMHYIRGITVGGEEEYTCKAVTTKEEAIKLIENGFQYVNTIDGYSLYRKRK